VETPVLLVHGILGQRHLYWNVFRNRLRRDGKRFHEVALPFGLLGDIRIASRMLADKVESILRGGATSVDLVCHSAGGLAARYYVLYLDGHKAVRHIVTLGTPHRGTHFGRLMPLPLSVSRQTRPGSNFLKELDRPLPRSVRVTSLWSRLDGVVIPSRNAILPGANNREMEWVTHWSFLWRGDVYEAVQEALATP
jgi:triacylglycerol esterase/lipase EstA (alpha/beta hydrolase family)